MAVDCVSQWSESNVGMRLEFAADDFSQFDVADHHAGDFLRLFAANRCAIQRYLRSLLPTTADVDDIFQETSLVLWREFDGFQAGTNFCAWACSIAFNRVRAWRTRRDREAVKFSEVVSLEVSGQGLDNTELHEDRLAALASCIGQLKPSHRELIRRRYEQGESVESIAKSSDQSVDAVYKMLSRIRHQLFQYVNQQTNAA